MSTIDTKAVFGVSFHPRMSSRKVTKLWFNEVTQEVRDLYPELNEAMLACQGKNLALDTSQITKELELEAKRIQDEAVAAAAALAAGLVAFPLAVIKAIQSIADMEINLGITKGCKSLLHLEIDKVVPDYIDN